MVLRYGVVIPPVGPWAVQERSYHWAEDVGYDAAYTYDHLTHPTTPGRWLSDGFTTLTAAAAVTSRIEIGTLVASATLHSPVALARQAMTVQDVSGGRAVLGLGAGSPLCAAADRDEHPTAARMGARFRDVVDGYLAVLRGEVAWSGEEWSYTGLETLPGPEGLPAPFLLLAAHGPRALEAAVSVGDGWNTYGGPGSTTLDPATFWELVGRQAARVDDLVAELGRTRALRRSLLLGFGQVRPTATAAAYVEAAQRAESLGFDELVVYGPDSPSGMGSAPGVHQEALSRLR